MTVKKRAKTWWYGFGNHKYRGRIPEARTKYEAQQAEIKRKRDVFDGKYGKQFGTMPLAKFVGDPDAANDQFAEGTFLDWASARGNTIGFRCVSCFKLSPVRH